MNTRRWVIPAFVFLIAVVAIALRLYRLEAVPPGLQHDEVFHGHDAVTVLLGHHAIYFPSNAGNEPLYIYLTASTIALFGKNPWASGWRPSFAAGDRVVHRALDSPCLQYANSPRRQCACRRDVLAAVHEPCWTAQCCAAAPRCGDGVGFLVGDAGSGYSVLGIAVCAGWHSARRGALHLSRLARFASRLFAVCHCVLRFTFQAPPNA